MKTQPLRNRSPNQTQSHQSKQRNCAATLAVQLVAVAGLTLAVMAPAAAYTINFDGYTAGTVISNQYPGVTFSAVPQSCGGSPVVHAVITTPTGGTSSGSRGIAVANGCPDFNPDYLRLDFAVRQSEVSFTLGTAPGTYQVRAFNATGGVLTTQSITISGSDYAGVFRFVRVLSASTNIARIEVRNTVDNDEVLDDLTYNPGGTPPVALLTAPQYQQCFCASNLTVRGTSCDADDGYDRDTLHYLPVGSTNWILVDNASTAVCAADGLLYFWNTGGLTNGWYYVKLTVYNDLGQSSEAMTLICIDRTVASPAIASPASGAIVGGTIPIHGTVNHANFDSYRVEYRRTSGGSYVPVDAAYPEYTTRVTNALLATWNTLTNTDGSHTLRLTAYDTCGNTNVSYRTVSVDNTLPTALLSAPFAGAARSGLVEIRGTATDNSFRRWSLFCGDGMADHDWLPLASSSTPASNTRLAMFDTSTRPPGPHLLRLVVEDERVASADGTTGNRAEYLLGFRVVSDLLAEDTDGDGMPDAWEKTYDFKADDPSDATLDADDDGQSNVAEYRAGTNPKDPKSVLRIEAIAREANHVAVTWATTPSHHYLLQTGTNLLTGPTNDASRLISIPPTGPSSTTVVHTNAATLPERFYRVRLFP